MLPLLLILFIALPIAELWLIIEIGGAIGILPTLALLIVDSLVGAALARSQSRAAWERFNVALAEGRIPAKEVFDGAMIILGGALLLTPGFITDAFGLVLLIPPTRALVRGFLTRLVGRRGAVAFRVASFGNDRWRGPGGGDGPSSPRGPDDRGDDSPRPPASPRRSSVDTDTRISDHALKWEQLLGKLSQVILTERGLLEPRRTAPHHLQITGSVESACQGRVNPLELWRPR